MDRTTTAPRRTAAGLGTVIVGTAAVILVPATASAAENVDSSYNLGCTLHPDQGYDSSAEPAGVRHDGERHQVIASPAQRLLSASSLAVYPAGAPRTGEDCDADADVRDLLTVGAGSSGLAVGDSVEVEVSIRLDADLDQGWDGDGPFETRSEYDAHLGITSLDDCTPGDEGSRCATPVEFADEHRHHLYGGPPDPWFPNGSVEAGAQRSYRFITNAGTELQKIVEEPSTVCDSWPCDADSHDVHPPQMPDVFTGTATLVVGHRYAIEGGIGVFTQAYQDVDTWATAAVHELSWTIDGPAGVDLAYASDGIGVEDTTAPEVSADVTPAASDDWHTAAPTVTFAATDTGSGVASITYSSTGAVGTPSTVAVGDSAVLAIGTDGVTEVTYSATDSAGNVSAPQALTVRLDTQAPVLTGGTDRTVPATGPSGAAVPYGVTATDNLGGPLTPVCVPADGTTFPVGTTPVTCTATDEAGNVGTVGFSVTVTALPTPDPVPAMDRLGAAIAASRAAGLTRTALTVAHRVADSQFDAGRTRVGCVLLTGLDRLVVAAGRTIPPAEAAVLRTLIAESRTQQGC